MKKTRIIARLDVKGPNVIKGIHLECLRIVGNPGELAPRYYLQGADELLYMDIVASLYGRQNLLNIVHQASDKIFIPFTVGGGVRTLDDIREFLKAGADKVAINTAITKNPALITEAARRFGSQCIVASIEAKRVWGTAGQGRDSSGRWEAYTNNGREKTGFDVLQWAKKVEELGAGEILLTSIDQEGTQQGFDLELIERVSSLVSIPVVACGGAGNPVHVAQGLRHVDAVGVASILHFNKHTISDVKKHLGSLDVPVRIPVVLPADVPVTVPGSDPAHRGEWT